MRFPKKGEAAVPGIEELSRQLPAGHPQESELVSSPRLPLPSSGLKNQTCFVSLIENPQEHSLMGKEGTWLGTWLK